MVDELPDRLDAATTAKLAETTRRAAAVEGTTVVRRVGAELDALVDDTDLADTGRDITTYGCFGAGMDEFLTSPECQVCGGSGKQLPDGFWCRPTEFTGRRSQGDGADG